MKKENTHESRILKHLQENGSITSLEAIINYSNTRLSATIYNLRQDGHNIVSVREKGKNKYGDNVNWVRYVLQVEQKPKSAMELIMDSPLISNKFKSALRRNK